MTIWLVFGATHQSDGYFVTELAAEVFADAKRAEVGGEWRTESFERAEVARG